MRELRLKESHIRFGEGSTREVGETARDLIGGTRAFVLTDTHCEKIAKTVRRSLKGTVAEITESPCPMATVA